VFLRSFTSAVDPADIDEVRRVFADDVVPVFGQMPGCLGIELVVNIEKNAGGLVEGAAVSRWNSLAELERALDSREVRESLVRILQLLRQEPVTKTFEILG
jgi:quinol monooxygenase YgiN